MKVSHILSKEEEKELIEIINDAIKWGNPTETWPRRDFLNHSLEKFFDKLEYGEFE